MTPFIVIDNQTGICPDCEKIALTEEWAKGLIYCDIDTFAITEDGNLILMDDCGNSAYCPADRFTIVFEKAIKSALEKQIPKKLRVDDEGWLCCPKCDETFKLHNQYHEKNRYCGNCGQKICWGDSE